MKEKKQERYVFSNHLSCHLLTNHQLHDVNQQYELASPTKYNEISLIKTDYVNFTLDLNYTKNEIVRSKEPGEPNKNPYSIIQNDTKVVNAIRKTHIDDIFGYQYEYITFSKKSGKGVSSWINTQDYSSDRDSLASEFFQCE